MTSAKTNYGITLGKQDTTGYVSIGELVSIDPPEITNGAVEATNHGSGGYEEWVSGGLVRHSEFKAVVNYVKANIATLRTDLLAGTKSRFEVRYDSLNAEQFGAIITGIKPMPADAKNPDVLTAEITFRPSDSFSLDS